MSEQKSNSLTEKKPGHAGPHEIQTGIIALHAKFCELFTKPSEERVRIYGTRLQAAADLGYIQKEIAQSLIDLLRQDDVEKFFAAGLPVWTVLSRLDIEEPEKMEELKRQGILLRFTQFKQLPNNKLIVYEEPNEKGEVHLHVLPNKTTELPTISGLVTSGLKELAQIALKDQRCLTFTGTSPLVAKMPNYFTHLGFTVSDASPDAQERTFFPNEKIMTATITRDVLIERYRS